MEGTGGGKVTEWYLHSSLKVVTYSYITLKILNRRVCCANSGLSVIL